MLMTDLADYGKRGEIMTDQEKRDQVVEELEKVIAEAVYPDRPRKFMIPLELAENALALLKKQEPEYPIHKQGKHGWFSYCPKCETILNHMARPRYCDRCGQAVKWL